MKKFLLALFFLSTCARLFSQDIPVFILKDTTVVTSGCYLLDPGGQKNGYTNGTYTIVINSATSSPLGIAFESSYLTSDGDRVNIYDGNSTSAPLITTIMNQSGSWYVKSSGSSMTISLQVWGPGASGPAYGFKAHIYPINPNPKAAQFATAFTGFTGANFDLADYDRDGDSDVINGGVVYRNDSKLDSSYVFLKQSTNPIGQWQDDDMASGDFDGDGYKDIFIIGRDAAILGSPVSARLYINDKKGGFKPSSQAFTGAFYGRCKVIDYNKDGKPDISYVGAGNNFATTFVFKLYINNGDGTFTEQTTNVPGLSNASLDWADADGDGDLDLVMNGEQGANAYAKLLINDKNVFTEKQIGLWTTTTGQICFADINKDGKPDIFNTGVETAMHDNSIPPQILLNDGSANFTRFDNDIPWMRKTYAEWADYDKDGDLDLLMSGTDRSYASGAYVYKNNGNGTFKRINLGGIESFSPVHWVDINKDGVLDAFVTAKSNHSYIAKTINSDSFAVVTLPMPAISSQGGAVIDDFNGDNTLDIMLAGTISDYDCLSGNSSVFMKGLGWQFSLVPKLTKAIDINASFGNVPGAPMWTWGDFDSDGLPDIAATSSGGVVRLYKNMGGNVFKPVFNGNLGSGANSKVRFVDLDRDGKNEMVMPPNLVYKWNGQSFDLMYPGDPYCCDVFNMDLGDYNNDGYIDMVLSFGQKLRIYKNDKTGKLVDINPYAPVQSGGGFVKFADMDKDGDLDIVATNFILENAGNDKFIYKADYHPPFAVAAIADFNNDTYPDIFGLPTGNTVSPSHLLYSQGPNFFYKENTPPGFPNSAYDSNQDAVAFDIEGDGDMDILQSSGICSSGLLLNNSNFLMDALSLVTPKGGEKLYAGNAYDIKWTGNNIGNAISIMFSSDNGKTFQPLQAAAPSGDLSGSYTWTVPKIKSDSCLLKITSTNQLSRISGTVFSITDSLPEPVIVMTDSICKNASVQNVVVKNSPENNSGVSVSAMIDAKPVSVTANQNIQFLPDTLAEGSHTLTITFTGALLKSVKSATFTIRKPAAPEVKLGASTNNVAATATTMIVLTATNKGGGGSIPKFTFATDRNFVGIVQQEGTGNSANLDPVSLNFGTNLLYVRMRTSDSCYAYQTAMDSVVITKSQPSPQLGDLPSPICKNAQTQYLTITNFPEANKGLNVQVTIDTIRTTVLPDHRIAFSPDTLKEGAHTLTVKFISNSTTTSAELTFAITKPVLPAVSLSASQISVINLSAPVVLTAVNENGGGASPTYTFAKDSSFSQIIQQESSSNKTEINASSLVFGNNKFFVMMKTSDGCFVRPTAIAGVTVTRTSATGIIDPDYPGDVIGVYPNPVGDQLNINSLKDQKTYRIDLINSNGQIVYSKELGNSTGLNIPTAILPSGIYELKIYDKTKNHLLGVMKLYKR
ncbi:FG-GAP-like repeat-containing protein [Pinibacter aurantiacus]|uniref:VCBS repeat-containing protein n=1 Tax=Pinibacter aurantiacus TaxID=2851599 RepID=A0A9E2S5A9_9BACT|nr:FG-GAP-like repeat-containing protein [Pinibacter aurantiacus]MBV4355902.1 VCBS repeat-containing protein [Pinibacter aurantiacus]